MPTKRKNALTSYSDGLDGYPILGHLLWYSVPEHVRVEHAHLVKVLAKESLEDFAPPCPKDKNVFLRVSSTADRKRIETGDPNVYENYLVRKVVDEGDTAIKDIVVEQVDSADRKLGHTAAVRIEYKAGIATATHLTANLNGEFDQAMNVADLVITDYMAERKMVNGYGIRDLLRRLLSQAGATTVRESGGIYFLMVAKVALVESLERIADALTDVAVTPVPLPDNSKQREMLQKAIEAETVLEIDRAINALDKLDGPVSAAKYGAMAEAMNATIAKTKEYADLLDEKLGTAQLHIQVYEARMVKLFKDGMVE